MSYVINMRWYFLLLILKEYFYNNEAFRISKEIAAIQCKAKFNVPYHDIEKIKNRQLPESKEGKCMTACILKKLKVMTKDGKFRVKTVKNWLTDKYKDDSEKLMRSYAKADACADHLRRSEDNECENAVKILNCSRIKKKEVET